MNIPHTGVMSSLDLHSGYFQLVVNPNDIVKAAFVTEKGTYAFNRMPFGLSGAAPNFQKAIDLILKPVIRWFEAGLTLNKDKCKFGCDKLKYLGLVISKEGRITTDEAKVKKIVEMRPPKNAKEMSNFLDMSEWNPVESTVGENVVCAVIRANPLGALLLNYQRELEV
ncbi:transposon Ty3-I Gag-Pol polyprotein [Trichonephila clavipes]|nr:transposon Ty3-I Gag-Pol polyprotein [Trichonephila clavipes]